jgi:hypothetical protein
MSDIQRLSTEGPIRDRRRTFIAVVLTEAVVVAALWAFSRYFGG